MVKIAQSRLTSIIYLIILLLFFRSNIHGQDISYAKSVINTLCTSHMHGRGYVKNGDGKAAGFIQREFARIGLKPLGKSYSQPFYISANTFPGVMKLKINDKSLVPGRNFMIDPASPKLRGKFDTYKISIQTENIIL